MDLILYHRGQRNSPMPTRSAGIPPTIPERDYSDGPASAAAGASEPVGEQEREPNPTTTAPS